MNSFAYGSLSDRARFQFAVEQDRPLIRKVQIKGVPASIAVEFGAFDEHGNDLLNSDTVARARYGQKVTTKDCFLDLP